MTYRILIFLSLLCITNASQPMEIVKKLIPRKHNNDDSINKELLFAHTIANNGILPREITKYIISYCAALKNKEFEYSPLKFQWFKNSVITCDYYFLTSQQKDLMNKLYISRCVGYAPTSPEVSYFLDSTKEYKLFLTLPIELRKHVTLVSDDIKSCYTSPISSLYINQNKTIQVKTTAAKLASIGGKTLQGSHFYESIPKPIIPEEIEKK
jgi:hypothetical protein